MLKYVSLRYWSSFRREYSIIWLALTAQLIIIVVCCMLTCNQQPTAKRNEINCCNTAVFNFITFPTFRPSLSLVLTCTSYHMTSYRKPVWWWPFYQSSVNKRNLAPSHYFSYRCCKRLFRRTEVVSKYCWGVQSTNVDCKKRYFQNEFVSL